MLVVSSDVTLASRSEKVRGTLVRPRRSPGDARASPGLLFVHGRGSDRSGYVVRAERAAAELGATCLAIDLTGHGGSSGTYPATSPRQHLADVLAAYDALAGRRDVDPARIGVCGASYGAYLAVRLTKERDVARLLARAPTIVADADLDTPLCSLDGDRRTATAQALVRALHDYSGPMLVVESENDEVIPRAVIDAYVTAARWASHEVIPGASHGLVEPEWRAAFEAMILRFFAPL